jgi:glycine cleavage system H protein
MMEDFPQELKYSESHEYVLVEGNVATIGITDYAAEQLGDIVYVELPKVGDTLTSGDSFGVIESVKAVSDLYLPVNGKVVGINENLTEHPELLTEDPYERGWIVKLELDDPLEAEDLMDAEAYAAFVSTL